MRLSIDQIKGKAMNDEQIVAKLATLEADMRTVNRDISDHLKWHKENNTSVNSWVNTGLMLVNICLVVWLAVKGGA